jgi:hypothetical protein
MNYATWDDFHKELDCWGEEEGAIATFWWRDDDAVQRTPQLDTLLAMANGHPLSLAVIPAMVECSGQVISDTPLGCLAAISCS